MAHEECGCGHDHNHEHVHEHECGCGHDHEMETVTITLDGETDIECNVFGVFDVKDQEYIALLPLEDDEVLLFKYSEIDGNADLGDIETDEEYAEVAEVFYELFMDPEDEFDEDELDDDGIEETE